jgi:hypothetical protein
MGVHGEKGFWKDAPKSSFICFTWTDKNMRPRQEKKLEQGLRFTRSFLTSNATSLRIHEFYIQGFKKL